MSDGAHDFYADTFDIIDGKKVVYNSKNPDVKYEVVNLLDASGNETDSEDEAAAGIVKFADECFVPFVF